MMEAFALLVQEAIAKDTLVHVTLSKPRLKTAAIKKVRIKMAVIKKQLHLSFVYRYATKDITKNFLVKDGMNALREALEQDFFIGTAFTTEADHILQVDKNGKSKIHRKAPTFSTVPLRMHDKNKQKLIMKPSYLVELGVLDAKGQVKKDKGDKYKQINKFVEIMAGLIKNAPALSNKDQISVVDMGAGKGYLTFALYDYLINTLKKPSNVVGVEVRKDLIRICNGIAEQVGFQHLKFEEGYIGNYFLPKIDILIALHACDTATDDAIAKGIHAGAELIICAPCCHKQIRKQMQCETHLQSILQYGIHKERLAEMVTDTIRAQLLEANGYKTKVFEFISTEHTGKNVMIVAQKRQENTSNPNVFMDKIALLKQEFGIKFHYLEQLLA